MSVKLAILASGTGVVVLAGVFAYNTGAVRVSVQEKRRVGARIHLLVPSVIIPLGLRLVPNDKLRGASEQLRPWLPAIERAAAELVCCPDGPLVEVEGAGEGVSVTKRNGSLVIDVDSKVEAVHISVPLSLVRSTARYLDSLHPVGEAAQAPAATPAQL